jgi:NaMN:DMB phosphoribosyltransferase
LTIGAVGSGTAVTLAGGTQMVGVAALVRHFGLRESVGLATTQFVADDDTADLQAAADDLDLALTVTDPAFPASEHVAFEQYCRGVAKEGAGMGGALDLLARSGSSMDALHERVVTRYEEVFAADGD